MSEFPQAKKASVVYPLLILSISALLVPYIILQELGWEDQISIQKGLFLFASGLLFFPSLFLALNNIQLHSQEGRKFVRCYKLNYSDVYDISNK